jgi:outer membrane biosynthesis protein TonB
MISAISHTINPNLNDASQQFRAQLNQVSDGSSLNISSEKEPSPSNPIQIPDEQPPEEQTPIDYEKLEKEIQNRNEVARDNARQAAVYAAELNNKQSQIDTYMDASSNSNNDTSSSDSFSYDPQKVYETSMDYSRNQELINIFETVAQNGVDQRYVNYII